MSPAGFAVLVPRADRLDVGRVAKALARFLDVPAADAALRARRSGGIVAEDLAEKDARLLAERLDEEKVGGWVLRQDAIASVPGPEPLRGLELAGGGFRPVADGGPGERLAGRSIRLLAAAAVGEELVLEVLLEAPARRLRIQSGRFDFSCLGAKMRYDARSNLRELARALGALAPGALKGRGTRTLLSGRLGAPIPYDDLNELEREERWLLTIA